MMILSLIMSPVWISVSALNLILPVCALNFSRPWFLSVNPGDVVTLNCPFGAIQTSVFWYKQTLGEMPEMVGKRLAYNDVSIVSAFQSSGFKMEKKSGDNISLIIPHVQREDAGLYYCGMSYMDDFTLATGTFLAVEDGGGVNVSVVQSGESDPVPAGGSVTLQCSVLSESRSEDLRVLWFRAASPPSRPQILYAHRHGSQRCESGSSTHTSLYNFSQNVVGLEDSGVYYCAVTLCRSIVFGSGTRLQLEETQNISVYPLIICVAVALGVCAVVIFAQIVKCTWRNVRSEDCLIKKSDQQGRELTFGASQLAKRRGKPEGAPDPVYTEVIYSSVS